jgi:hypothetical protein
MTLVAEVERPDAETLSRLNEVLGEIREGWELRWAPIFGPRVGRNRVRTQPVDQGNLAGSEADCATVPSL